MGRAPCCDKSKVKRGPWSPHEDEILRNYLHNHGTGGNWISLPLKAGLKRCGKSCRLRWLNYLRPNIKHGSFTHEEDNIIFNLYSSLGSRWSIIASQLPGRTDNDVKNHWNTKLKKKLLATQDSYFTTMDQTPQASSISTTTTFTDPKVEADYNPVVSTDFQDPGFFLEMPSVVGVQNHTQTGNIINTQEYSSITDSLVSMDNDTCEFLMDFGPGFTYDQMMSTSISRNNDDHMSLEEALINLPTTSSHANPAVWQNFSNQSYGSDYN